MVLEADFKQLKSKRKNDDYQPARLSYVDIHGQAHDLEIKVRPRGNMRRATCDIPPMKIKFPNSSGDSKTLKLVNICKESDLYEQLLLREYAAYRLYNILTEQSLQVLLVKMKFVDKNGKDAPRESFAFFIEHQAEVAKRGKGEVLEQNIISRRMLNTDEYERLCIFQFMIGNTDWLVYTGHNLKVFGIKGDVKLIYVPYDFDYAGLVNAPYAVPDERLKLPHITNRYYMGFCRPKEKTIESIQLFLDKKEEIMRFCEEFPHFDNSSRKHVLKYTGSFFDIIENPKKYKAHILKHCDRWPNP